MSYRLLEDGSSKRLLEDGTSKRLLEDGAGGGGGNRRRRALFVGIDGMHILKQSTAATDTVGPILDSTGAEYTGAVIGDLSISKNGTEAAMAAAATLTHISNGMYTLVFTTGNTDTLGRVVVRCNKSTYQMPPVRYEVVASAVFDTLVTNGTLASTTSGRTIVTDAAGLVDANTVKLGPTGSGTAQTARDIGASVLLSSGTGTGQLDFTSGVVKANTTQFGGSAITSASGIPEVKLTNGAHGGAAGVLTLSRIIVSSATTNTPGVTITGNGTGVGMVVTGGASGGDGVQFTGGAAGGIGFQCYGPAGTGASFAGTGALMAGLSITSQVSDALVINGATGGTGAGIVVTGGATAGDAVQFTASGGNSDAIQLTSAGSGHALSAVGTVNVSGAATFASTLTVSGATTLTGAVTASNASNNIVGIDVAKISGDATAADNAESFFDGTGYAGTNNVIPLVTTTTTVTNLTNAPTAGDFTATMKTSIGTAVAASAVASVTGNVGGNVTGSVGSLATQAKADVNAEVLDVIGTDTLIDGKTISNALKYIAAGVVGRISGAGTGTEVFLGLDEATTRVTVTVDSSGNRTDIVYG